MKYAVNRLRSVALRTLRSPARFRRWRDEQAAWQDLKLAGGAPAVEAMQAGFARAEAYRTWDAWSLDATSILWIASLILTQNIRHIVEFGAGYSTIALSEFLSRQSPQVQIDSFEHQPEFATRIREHVAPAAHVNLHCVDLLQLDDETFECLFVMPNPSTELITRGVKVPPERHHETRLRNTFYSVDFSQWEPDSVDLVILDGPNGNGRSLAFPLMKHVIRVPGYVFIDDYLDYPFVEGLERVFVSREQAHVRNYLKDFVLLELSAKR